MSIVKVKCGIKLKVDSQGEFGCFEFEVGFRDLIYDGSIFKCYIHTAWQHLSGNQL